jgi:hypothetical protein
LVLGAHKPALAVAGLVLLLIVIVAMISSVWPSQEEWFLELGLLGKDKTADAYFANSNSAVDVGALNSWFIYVHNHMGAVQDVSVRAKLLNSTMELPNDREHQPSSAVSFAEFPLSLSVNETVLIPFSWSIMEVEGQNGSTVIKRLMVNEQLVAVDISAPANSSFRIIIELWVKDWVSGEYKFGWESKEGFSSASIYMRFKLNSSGT